MTPSGTGRFRGLWLTLLVSVGAGAGLYIGFGAAAKGAVLGRLRETDPQASVQCLSLAPGVVMLEGINLPSLGLRMDTVVAWWSGSPLSPQVDSVLVNGGNWTPTSASSAGLGNSGETCGELPPVRFNGIELAGGGSEIAILSGTISGGESRRGAFSAIGGWGMASGGVRFMQGPDSIAVDWFTFTDGSSRLIPLPQPLQGHTIEGNLHLLSGERPVGTGNLTSFDGRTVEAAFSISQGPEGMDLTAELELQAFSGAITAVLDSLLGGAPFQVVPRGTLGLAFLGGDTLLVDADAVLDSVMLYHPALSDDTVRTTLYLGMTGTAVLGTGELRVDSGTLGIGPAMLSFSLYGRFTEPARLELRVWNHGIRGEDISMGVPEGMLGRLDGLRLDGQASVDLTVVLDWGEPELSDFRSAIDVTGLGVVSCPVSVGAFRTGGSCLMRDSWGNSRLIRLDPEEDSSFVPFDSFPPGLEGILKCAEDASFRSHSGFSEYHIRNSIRADIESGAFIRGGSTISMQLARNLLLDRDKNLARKLQEVFLTWRLEQYLSKDRILEIYCNIVELGPATFGFPSAALYYFDTDLRDLSTRELAYLVSLLPGPSLYHRFYRDGRVPGYWNDYLDRLVSISGDRGWIPRDSVSAALADSIIFRPGA